MRAAVRAEMDWLEELAGITETRESGDFSLDEMSAATSVSPSSAAEIAEVLRFATHKALTILPTGGGTKLNVGAIPESINVLLNTGKLNSVHHYDSGDLTVGVGAGTTVAEIQQTLSANAQFLPLDVAQPEKATIGGVLATNAHGPLKAGYGGVRDYCIGIEFATADGKIAKAGGKVVKNVAGYDLMKLMIGSFGSLGVITSANFKVFPRPRQTTTFVAHFDSARYAIMFRDHILNSPLGTALICLEIVSPRAQEYLAGPETARDPDGYAPAAPLSKAEHWTIYLRASGSDSVLARYRRELGGTVSMEMSGSQEQEWWRRVSDFEHTVATRHRNALILHIHSPLAMVADALRAGEQVAVEHNFIFAAIGRAFPGALTAALLPLSVDPPSAVQYAAAVSAFRGALPRDATALVARCPVEAKRRFNIWGTSPTDALLMRAIKKTLDPAGVLNRGRFLTDL